MKYGKSIAIVILVSVASGCGSAGGDTEAASNEGSETATESATPGETLSQIELEQGIGPIRDLTLGTIDPAIASAGESSFNTKCGACHKIDERYVGPRLGTVLARRRPEFVMNMILNSNEMVERHPVVRELLGQFYTPMPTQVTDQEEARAILEYLRTVQVDSTTSPSN